MQCIKQIIIYVIIALKNSNYLGMFGVKLHERRDLIEGLARALILSGQNRVGHQDQASLDRILWPVAKYDVVK